MFEMVKAIHEALGLQSTLAFVLVIAAFFAVLSGGTAWIVDRGYKNSLKERNGVQATDSRPGDKGTIATDLAPAATGPTAQRSTSEAKERHSAEKQPSLAEKQPTLSELFNKDFPNTMKAADEAIGIQWQDGTVLHVKRQVYLDFPAKAQFVGFYLPSSDPFSDRTYNACLRLGEAVQQAIDDLPKRLAIRAGYRDEGNTLQELTFSGRVFLYHEDFLSIPQKADIINAYRVRHFDVQFRGPEYLGDQIIAWHRQHDPKKGR